MRVTPEAKQATRQRILGVATELFARLGFEATTTRDLARAAQIAAGTLFNYFPTKEAIVGCLVGEAYAGVAEAFCSAADRDGMTLEEELFAHVAAILRKLKPHRAYLPAALETSLSPLAPDQDSPRAAHLETVVQIAARHGQQDALSTMALQLYWTLYTGVLAHWVKDASPRQEDTLALLDQSVSMFVGWLLGQGNEDKAPRNGR